MEATMNSQALDGFGKEWLKAWNDRDLEAILSHYADDVEMRSPLVVHLLGDPAGSVRGKSSLRHYFETVIRTYPAEPGTGLELLGVYQGVSSMIVFFQAKDGRAAEMMELTEDGKIRRAVAHFAS
jgi:ketosteroid isomerase-like protein